MKYIRSILTLLLLCIFGACTENTMLTALPEETPDEEGLEEVSLHLKGLPVRIIGEDWDHQPQTRIAATGNPNENLISNIWVMQYNAAGTQLLTAPRYYALNPAITTTGNAKVMLRPATNSVIHIIANTNSSAWVTGRDISTVAKLNSQTQTFSTESAIYGGANKNLLMAGSTTFTVIAGANNNLGTISLKRMVAKINFKYTLAAAVQGKLTVTKITIENIPNIIKVGEPTATYPATLTPCSYNEITAPTAGSTYTWYIPENLQGSTANTNEKTKNEGAPGNAFIIRLYIDSGMDGSNYIYTLYPGENKTNDFNIKRNYTYNVSLALNSSGTDSRVMAAPANCFVMKRNSKIIFDPYDRSETGGGWKYTDYVNKNVPDKSFNRVSILWQTGNGTNFAIGNNAANNLVYLDKTENKVYVTSGNIDGNAVIAGYNAKGVIIWSWHIWVNESAPAQISNAVKYTTYNWDSNGIYTNNRVEGYSFMACNLGATSTNKGNINTYGLYYQWGRKDPFPQTAFTGTLNFYPNKYPYVTPTYNNNASLINMSSTIGAEEVFQTVRIDASTGNINYAINHPTVFMATVRPALFENGTEGSVVVDGVTLSTHDPSLYVNDGDWYWGHNDKLWGGIPFSSATINYNNIVANNGAVNKSIFDPCPSGWMLPKSDAWMGFTNTGLNTSATSDANHIATQNYENYGTERVDHGMIFYMQAWRSGPTSFFPLCGWRTGDGSCFVVNACGGYYTSASSFNNATSIFHIHPSLVNPYDYGYQYSRRSCAYPIRCVRETK